MLADQVPQAQDFAGQIGMFREAFRPNGYELTRIRRGATLNAKRYRSVAGCLEYRVKGDMR
jgi:hypothetical protein